MAHRYTSCTFVGDWFRCIPQNQRVSVIQAGNVAWLSRLLATAIGIAPAQLRTVMPSADAEDFARQLDDSALLARYERDATATWAQCYDGNVSPACFAELYDALIVGSLVVGFEIPPVMRRALADRGFDYLSLHNHPIRFLKDLAFGAHTNAAALAATLTKITCNPREIDWQAARFSARFARLDPVQSRLPEQCPILFGQTAADASLIAEGSFVRWADRVDALADALRNHAEIAFVRHPQAVWQHDIITLLRSRLGKTVIGISGNSYPLIMSGRSLGPVLTLSSSIGAEAMACGYDVRFLLADPREKFAISGLDNPSQILLDHRLFEPALWEQILDRTGAGLPAHEEAFYLGKDFVRGTLESWSFAALDAAEPFVPMEKIVIPAAGLSSTRVDELAGILAGTAPDDRENAIVEARRHQIDLECVAGPLTIGQTWRWDRDSLLSELPLVDRFYPIEGDGAWINGDVGTIEVPLVGKAGEHVLLEGEVVFSFFRGILQHTPALLLKVNGQPCAAMMGRSIDEAYHCLPFSAVVPADAPCVLRMECSHAAAPAELGMGSDHRVLAALLHGVTISARPVVGSGDLGMLRVWGVGDHPIEISSQEE